MTQSEALDLLRHSIATVLDQSGFPTPNETRIPPHESPFESVPHFDSMLGVHLETLLEDHLAVEIPSGFLFNGEDGPPSLEDLAVQLSDLTNGSNEHE